MIIKINGMTANPKEATWKEKLRNQISTKREDINRGPDSREIEKQEKKQRKYLKRIVKKLIKSKNGQYCGDWCEYHNLAKESISFLEDIGVKLETEVLDRVIYARGTGIIAPPPGSKKYIFTII